MFDEPLQHNEYPGLFGQVLALSEAYYEFHCYCLFFVQAQAGLAGQSEDLDDSTAFGIHMASRCLTQRSEKIMQRLDELLEAVRTKE